jgi:hypothetical protein
MLRWLKTVVVSDEEKALVEASGRDREGERERGRPGGLIRQYAQVT